MCTRTVLARCTATISQEEAAYPRNCTVAIPFTIAMHLHDVILALVYGDFHALGLEDVEAASKSLAVPIEASQSPSRAVGSVR